MKPENLLAPYVSTRAYIAELMVKATNPKNGDVLVDIGSGEGMILYAGVLNKNIKRIVGIECRTDLAERVEKKIKEIGLEKKIEIKNRDVFNVDLSEINPQIVTVYLNRTGLEKIRPKLENELKPETRVVSNTFKIEPWKPIKIIETLYTLNPVYLYRMDSI